MDNKETIDSKTIEENFVKWSIPRPTQDYMVVVHCSTYNHGRYIEDALKGFVMQKTDFPFCAIVIDDGSTDDAPNIIRRYAENYPEIIKPILLGENHMQHGKSRNPYFDDWHNAAKYIAFCEGDDYWTDPLKLQKQVDFLEEHEECVMCTHAAYWDINGELYKEGCRRSEECDLTSDEVIKNGGLYLATASLVFRKELADDWPKWRKLSDVGDYPLQILGTLRGKLHFFPQVMSVYRFMHEGSWTAMMSERRVKHAFVEIGWLGVLDEETDKKYHRAIQTHLFSKFIRLLYRENKISTRRYAAAYCDSEKTISIYHFLKDILRHFVMSIEK